MRRWKQSFLVGLSAAVLLGAAGAYAISIDRLASPGADDLPTIVTTRPLEMEAAPAVTPEPVGEAADAPSEEPNAQRNPSVVKPPEREVVVPDVREEEPDDDEEEDEIKPSKEKEEHEDSDSPDTESSSDEYDD